MSSHRLSQEGPSNSTLVLSPSASGPPHSASVILIHGLGDSAHGWIDTAASSLAPALPHAKFILPTAHEMPVTWNGGAVMPAWYDIVSLSSKRSEEKCDGIVASEARILELIHREMKAGIPASRIVLSGFSQGGAMTLFTGLRFPEALGGLVVMSGYMPVPASVTPSGGALETPVWMGHGTADAVVPASYGADAYERAKALGVKRITWNTFPGMPHTVIEEEVEDVISFLKSVIPAHASSSSSAAANVSASAASSSSSTSSSSSSSSSSS